MPPKRTLHDELIELVNLHVDRVDLVDLGAVPKSRWLIQKSDDAYAVAKAAKPKVLPYRDLPMDMEMSWDAGDARKRMRAACMRSALGNGEVDMKKYARGFMIMDGDPENTTSYKYPIATIKDGKMTGVFASLSAAVGRGKTNLPADIFKKMMSVHVRRYYKKANKELPETMKAFMKAFMMTTKKADALVAFASKISDDTLKQELLDLVGKLETEGSGGSGDTGDTNAVITELMTRLDALEASSKLAAGTGATETQPATGSTTEPTEEEQTLASELAFEAEGLIEDLSQFTEDELASLSDEEIASFESLLQQEAERLDEAA